MALVRVLSARIGQTERAIEDIFGSEGAPVVSEARARAVERAGRTGNKARRGSVVRVWRELVVARKRDIAFLTLAAFVVTLLAVRLAVYLAFRFDVAPRDVLRAAYMTGFGSLVASACASLLTFRPAWRRAIAVFYGVGTALILNDARRHARVRHLLQGHPHPGPERSVRHRGALRSGDGCPRHRHRARRAHPGGVPAPVLPARRVPAHDARATAAREGLTVLTRCSRSQNLYPPVAKMSKTALP